MAILYNLRRFGIFCNNLEYFYPFWYVVPRKIWQPWSQERKTEEEEEKTF
jgi:hypothetical protein